MRPVYGSQQYSGFGVKMFDGPIRHFVGKVIAQLGDGATLESVQDDFVSPLERRVEAHDDVVQEQLDTLMSNLELLERSVSRFSEDLVADRTALEDTVMGLAQRVERIERQTRQRLNSAPGTTYSETDRRRGPSRR